MVKSIASISTTSDQIKASMIQIDPVLEKRNHQKHSFPISSHWRWFLLFTFTVDFALVWTSMLNAKSFGILFPAIGRSFSCLMKYVMAKELTNSTKRVKRNRHHHHHLTETSPIVVEWRCIDRSEWGACRNCSIGNEFCFWDVEGQFSLHMSR